MQVVPLDCWIFVPSTPRCWVCGCPPTPFLLCQVERHRANREAVLAELEVEYERELLRSQFP